MTRLICALFTVVWLAATIGCEPQHDSLPPRDDPGAPTQPAQPEEWPGETPERQQTQDDESAEPSFPETPNP